MKAISEEKGEQLSSLKLVYISTHTHKYRLVFEGLQLVEV